MQQNSWKSCPMLHDGTYRSVLSIFCLSGCYILTEETDASFGTEILCLSWFICHLMYNNPLEIEWWFNCQIWTFKHPKSLFNLYSQSYLWYSPFISSTAGSGGGEGTKETGGGGEVDKTNENEEEEQSVHMLLLIIGVPCAALLIIFVVVLLCLCCRRRRYSSAPGDDVDVDVDGLTVNSAYYTVSARSTAIFQLIDVARTLQGKACPF